MTNEVGSFVHKPRKLLWRGGYMGFRIATNIQALSSQRNLGLSGAAQKNVTEHLASGSRINKAADDAAGLAISEKMKGLIRSLRQDGRNANDGISMIQTAEGGMNEIGNILTRFRELAIQSASDTLGNTERGFINKEVQQLKQEIDRIAVSTEFNGKKLLMGEGDSLDIQVGVHNDAFADRFSFDPQKTNVTLDHLGLKGINVASKESAREVLDSVDHAINTLVENRAELGALQNRLQSTINNINIYDENLSAANSRIRDADIATESSELMKNNILQQAGVSVLSQANQNNMLALKLLG
jgi:flagellin